MNHHRRPRSIVIGSILMVLLGLARSMGGAIILMQGQRALPPELLLSRPAPPSPQTIMILGLILTLIGLLEVVAGVGVFQLRRRFWTLGIVTTIAFVIDGAINGWLLFGKPGDQGTMVNLLVAGVIISCLIIGRQACRAPLSPAHR